MAIKLIVALGKNNEMGFENQLLEHFPEDMKFFKNETKAHFVLMGSNTWDSIPNRPLKDRFNVIISRNPLKYKKVEKYWDKQQSFTGVTARSSISEFISEYMEIHATIERVNKSATPPDLFIIGGKSIYKQTLNAPFLDELIITHINKEYPSATHFFPEIGSQWIPYSTEQIANDLTVTRYKRA